MTEMPGSSVQKLEDRLNNNGCINFCRDKAFPLAATSNKQCVCLNSLPATLLAISTDEHAAASGPSSSCNIKCPGDAGESCFKTSCCGGPEQAYSIYATGEVDYLGQLLNLLETHKNTIQTNALGLPEGGSFHYWVEFYSRMPENKVKRCAFVSTVEVENGKTVDKVQKGCSDYTASTDDLKRVDFNVISVKKEASKPYPTRETPLTGDFDVELDNTGGSTERSFTKSRTVEAVTSQTYSVESGTSSSFTVGASVSAGFEALGAEFSVELSTEYSTSGFYNSGYQKSSQEKITTAFQITSKVPAGVRTIARFSKRTEPLTLKWGATIHAEGEIKLSYVFAKFGYPLKRNQTVTVSLSQAIPSRQTVFYTMGTVRAEARVVIGAKMDSYDAEGNLIKSQPASSSQVSEVRTSRQRDPGHRHSFRKMNPKHKKNTHRGKY